MHQIKSVLNDRGSKYAVSGGAVTTRETAKALVETVKQNRKFAKATHHSWAVLFRNGEACGDDDGEAGAAAVIQRMLERAELYDHIVVVTRWYGGKNLGGDRFRHIQTCVRTYLAA